jgi:hypothetical protein
MIIWTILIGGLVVGMTTSSLMSTYKTRRDIASGRPEYLSLADYIGIFDRQVLLKQFGPADAEDRYTVSRETAKKPRLPWSRLFDSMTLDVASFVTALVVGGLAANRTPGPWWPLALACAYQVIGCAVVTWVGLTKATWPEDNQAIQPQ